MTNELAVRATAGQVANAVAAKHSFIDYAERLSKNTLRAQHSDLKSFAIYLEEAQTPVIRYQVGSFDDRDDYLSQCADRLHSLPDAWLGITWGLVAGYVRWLLAEGHAIGTVNRRLSTIKRLAQVAAQAGAISAQELALIQTVKGYGHKQATNLDEKRQRTRSGHKKAKNVTIPVAIAMQLKQQPDTPQGRRDTLMMAIMLDQGLRVGEVVILQREWFDLELGLLRFSRPKVNKDQTHELSFDVLQALRRYINFGDCPASGCIWRRSRKNGELADQGLTVNAVNIRVGILGAEVGIVGLSPHDCRHFWATQAARDGVDPLRLQEAGGWSSLTMPRRYVEASTIANKGMIKDNRPRG